MARPFHNKKRRGQRHKAGNRQFRMLSPFSRFGSATACEEYAEWASTESNEFHSNDAWGNSDTLVEGPFTPEELRSYHGDGTTYPTLNRTERRFIARHAGCIIHVDSQGFVNVDWFKNADELHKEFDERGENYDDDESSSDEDGSDESEPADDDIVTNDYRTFRTYGGSNAVAFTVPENGDWTEYAKRFMDEQQFWPNVWYVGERGDLNLLSVETGEFADS